MKIQGQGNFRKSHNVLSQDNVVRLYQFDTLSRSHPEGIITRLSFYVAFMTAL